MELFQHQYQRAKRFTQVIDKLEVKFIQRANSFKMVSHFLLTNRLQQANRFLLANQFLHTNHLQSANCFKQTTFCDRRTIFCASTTSGRPIASLLSTICRWWIGSERSTISNWRPDTGKELAKDKLVIHDVVLVSAAPLSKVLFVDQQRHHNLSHCFYDFSMISGFVYY